jgi:hypothetical protein
MAASLCHSEPQDMHRHGPFHSAGNALSSPFVFMSSDLQSASSSRTQKLLLDLPLLSSGKTVGLETDTAAYCTTISVSDIAMEPAVSPTTADRPPPGPLIATAIPSPEQGKGEQPAKTPNRRSLESAKERQSTRTPPSSTRRRRSGSHTPGSRSSSRHKTPGQTRSGKPLVYGQRQTQHDRDLVALHRESCRLFEAFGSPGNNASDQSSPNQQPVSPHSLQSPAKLRIRRSFTEPLRSTQSHSQIAQPMSPQVDCTHTNLFEQPHSPHPDNAEEPENEDQTPQYKPVPATVIDWTLPSTRKREYEKIDRSSRGIRGIWRKVAPRWCQSGGQRTPFFDESKRGKEYEGSVRRFRIDVPDDDAVVVEKTDTKVSTQEFPAKPKARRGFPGLSRRHTEA